MAVTIEFVKVGEMKKTWRTVVEVITPKELRLALASVCRSSNEIEFGFTELETSGDIFDGTDLIGTFRVITPSTHRQTRTWFRGK